MAKRYYVVRKQENITTSDRYIELVISGETGYLIKKDSSRSCAEALRLIFSDPERFHSMQKKAVQLYEQRFNLRSQLAKTEKFLWECGQNGYPENYKIQFEAKYPP